MRCPMKLLLGCRIQCSLCVQWRIITYDTLLQVRSDASWTCAQLRCTATTCISIPKLHTSNGHHIPTSS